MLAIFPTQFNGNGRTEFERSPRSYLIRAKIVNHRSRIVILPFVSDRNPVLVRMRQFAERDPRVDFSPPCVTLRRSMIETARPSRINDPSARVDRSTGRWRDAGSPERGAVAREEKKRETRPISSVSLSCAGRFTHQLQTPTRYIVRPAIRP